MASLAHLTHYELQILRKLTAWQKKVQTPAGVFSRIGKKMQDRVNRAIPDKVHQTITTIIRKMVETVLFTSALIKPATEPNLSLEMRESAIEKRLEYYRGTAAAEGGITGWGGFLSALADFPALLAIKLKYLFDVAALYGYDTSDMRERIYLLYIFQLAFSSPHRQSATYLQLETWARHPETIPAGPEHMDWYRFQQDYRDYLDLAKLLQMMPGIGAAVGFVVNYRLLNKLHETTTMCYRMRWLYAKQPG